MSTLYPFSKDRLPMLPDSMDAGNRSLSTLLAGTPGVTVKNEFRGTLRAGRRSAQLRLVSGEWVHLWIPLGGGHHAPAPGPAARDLPGNVRHAIAGGERYLLAETRLNGVDHLRDSLGEISAGMSRALAKRPSKVEPGEIPGAERVSAAVEAARRELALDPTEAIEVKDGCFELRPRLGGQSVAVRINREPGGVRLSHTISRTACAEEERAVLETEALHQNGRCGFARCIATVGGLDVGARLRSSLIEGDWIALITRAIAAVALRVQAPARLLIASPALRRDYAMVFRVDSNQQQRRCN